MKHIDISLESRLGTSGKAPAAFTKRGASRRKALLDAALRIIVKDGPGAVTLRSVVAEAKASHGSVAYYFGTREELIHQALMLVANHNIDALAHAWAEIENHVTDRAKVAELISRHSAHQMIEDRSMGITIIELHLAAARYPELRPALRQWGRAYARITHRTLAALGASNPEADAALLISAINGLVINQLALPRRDFERRIMRPAVLRLLLTFPSLDANGPDRLGAASPPAY